MVASSSRRTTRGSPSSAPVPRRRSRRGAPDRRIAREPPARAIPRARPTLSRDVPDRRRPAADQGLRLGRRRAHRALELRRRLGQPTIYLGRQRPRAVQSAPADPVRRFTLEASDGSSRRTSSCSSLPATPPPLVPSPRCGNVPARRCWASSGRVPSPSPPPPAAGSRSHRHRRHGRVGRVPGGDRGGRSNHPRRAARLPGARPDGRGRNPRWPACRVGPPRLPRAARPPTPRWTPSCSAAPTTRCCGADRGDRPGRAWPSSASTPTAVAVEDLLDALGARAPASGTPSTGSRRRGTSRRSSRSLSGSSASDSPRSNPSRSSRSRRFP